MKHFLSLLAISVFMINGLLAQEWKNNLPQNKVQNGTVTFQETQQAFYQEYPADEIPDGKRVIDGELKKIPGWKQFKRWEYYWETRIDLQTGLFPSEEALAELSIANSSKQAITGGGNWSNLGPDASPGGYAGLGRVNTVGFHPTDNNTYWAGTAGGGLWKTTDGAATWTVQTDNVDVLGISAIAVPSDYATSNTILIGTGDKNGRNNNSVGILKSTDGGTTWGTTSLTYSIGAGQQVCRILIHPANDQEMLAATTDGIYKSIDGGDNWVRKTGTGEYRDMEYKPGDPTTVYASSYSDFYKSTDGGDTWTTTQSITGNGIEICVSANQPTWVYALVVNGAGGLQAIYKSADSGSNYTAIYTGDTDKALMAYECDGSGANTGQGWYDRCIAVNPTDANEVYIGGVNTWRSADGGLTWNINTHWSGTCSGSAVKVHADKHFLGYQNGSTILFEGNDGGLYKTNNSGSTWSFLSNGMSISQMYKIGVSKTVANEVVTGLQDNGTKLYSSNTWSDVKGGDGMECLIDYTDVNVQYGTYVNGQLDRTTNHWGNRTSISDNIPGGEDGAWVSPYVIDPVNNQTLYMGYSDVWKTTDRGDSWTKISTMNTSDKLRAMAIAPSNNQVLYASGRNQIWKTTDGGTAWTEITGTLPVTTAYITYITVKNDDSNTLWITFGQYNNTSVYQSTDGGANWTNISAGLPSLAANSVVQNTQNTTDVELYVSTDVGVYQRVGINNWTPYSTNLPNVKATELEIYYDEANPTNSRLRAGTYGRGLWETELPSTVSCTAPTNQANTYSATAIGDNQMTVNWTRGDGDRVVVLAHAGALVTSSPGNGESYTASANAIFGNGTEIGTGNYVVYDGTGTNVTVTGLISGTVYHYSVFEYASAENCYLTPGLTGSATTTGTPPCAVCDDVSSASDDGAGVTLFSFNSINNSSTGDPAYTDYTAISTTVTQGTSYALTVNVNTAGPYTVNTKVWVDWNQNCDFTDPGEEYDLGSAIGVADEASGLSPLSITIPGNASIGNTALRVRATYNTAPISCGEQSYSEAEDYTINVQAAAGHDVTFNVTDGTDPIENAAVTFNGTTQNTNVAGVSVFTGVAIGNTQAYSIVLADYTDVNGTVDVIDQDVVENAAMSEIIPGTKLIDALCGTTVNTTYTWISCDTVTNAEDYEFLFENAGAGYSESKTTESVWGVGNGSTYKMRLYYIPNIQLGLTYDVKVRAKVNGIWGDYGSVCQYNLVVQNTKLQDAQCNSSVTSLSTMLYADPVTYAEDYEFHFTNAGTGYDEVKKSSEVWGIDNGYRRYFRMYYLPNLEFGQTYDVQIRAKVKGVWGDYGTTCQLSLSVQSTKLRSDLCDGNAPTTSTMIYANPVTYAQDYEFWFVNDGIGFNLKRTSSSVWGATKGYRRYFRMYYMSGVQTGYVYQVRVRAKVAGVWGEFGDVCSLTVGPVSESFADNKNSDSFEINDDLELVSYPNPFNTNTTIMINGDYNLLFDMKIFDVTGKVIIDKEIVSNEHYIVGQEFGKGIYFVVVTNNRGFSQKTKLVKMR